MNQKCYILFNKERSSKGIVVYDFVFSNKKVAEYDLFIEKPDCKSHSDFAYIKETVESLKRIGSKNHCGGFNKGIWSHRKEFNEKGETQGFALPPRKNRFKKKMLRLYHATRGVRTVILCGGFIKNPLPPSWQKNKKEIVESVECYKDAMKVLDKMEKEKKIYYDTYNGGYYCVKRQKLCIKIDLNNEECEVA